MYAVRLPCRVLYWGLFETGDNDRPQICKRRRAMVQLGHRFDNKNNNYNINLNCNGDEEVEQKTIQIRMD